MLPSSTVENYLKQIYLEQPSPGELVPMGKLANSMGVVPGTATSMVKALADSGLVEYEPRGGARLTRGGERLALRVLRRHRLVELFLVKVLGLVNSAPDFVQQPQVVNGVSDLLVEVFGETIGRHARSAVGAVSLPLNAPVEIEMVVEVEG